MKDTPENIEAYQRNLIYAKTAKERFDIGIEMYEMARQMAIDSIRRFAPQISEKEMKMELFRRFYKNDFSEEEMQKILVNFK